MHLCTNCSCTVNNSHCFFIYLNYLPVSLKKKVHFFVNNSILAYNEILSYKHKNIGRNCNLGFSMWPCVCSKYYKMACLHFLQWKVLIMILNCSGAALLISSKLLYFCTYYLLYSLLQYKIVYILKCCAIHKW